MIRGSGIERKPRYAGLFFRFACIRGHAAAVRSRAGVVRADYAFDLAQRAYSLSLYSDSDFENNVATSMKEHASASIIDGIMALRFLGR